MNVLRGPTTVNTSVLTLMALTLVSVEVGIDWLTMGETVQVRVLVVIFEGFMMDHKIYVF